MKTLLRRLGPAGLLLAALLLLPVPSTAAEADCAGQIDADEKAEARRLLGNHWERRAALYKRDIPTSVTNVTSMSPDERGMGLALRSVDRVVTGELTTLDHLNPWTRRLLPDGQARQRRIPFVLTLPETDQKEVPVVMFGHGAKTSRELVYLVANRLAEAGFAVIAIDFPYHGTRSICTRHSQCAGPAWCTERGTCRRTDGTRGRVRTIEAPDWLWAHGPEYPITSGHRFFEMDDFTATRAHFDQALVDLMQTRRVIRGADWPAVADGVDLAGDEVSYFGISLGAILGANLAAIEPDIQRYALNAPGGEFVELIEGSKKLNPRFERMLRHRQYERQTREFADLRRRAEAELSSVDPVDVGPHATGEPFAFFDARRDRWRCAPRREILIQMARDDRVVPNRSTRLLASAMELPIAVYEPLWLEHHTALMPLSLAGRRARSEVVDFLE
jgi:pimeloyl-ACP methyl ester carboxylesterase